MTNQGATLAEECRQRHALVFAILRFLGVPEAIAQIDAEGIEHHVSKETLAAFRKFIR